MKIRPLEEAYIRHALYDIHEYADILHKNNKNYIDVEELAELILERVDFIREQLWVDE
tara:strand:+ start:166 stop:339 length:174 start_codon:yes stop_codon:yes gene_type:complete